MARKDPVTPELIEALIARDGGCIASRLGFVTECITFGGRPWEVDHIHPRGFGLRGLSILSNTALLCYRHHRDKTEHGSTWRPRMDAYVAEKARLAAARA